MTARQALLVALESEQKAHSFFMEAIPHIRDTEARALFEELRDEEVLHQKLVSEELAALPAETKIDEDLVDEPVAQ